MKVNVNNDWFYSSKQFQDYFKGSPRSLILKADAPHFRILAASDDYLELTYRTRSEILNRPLFEAFPGSQADPSEQNSVFSSFQRVIATKETDVLPVFKYEIYVQERDRMETEYWSNRNEPILDEWGNVAYIINTTANVTRQVLNEQAREEADQLKRSLEREQALNEELAASNEELISVNEEMSQIQHSLHELNAELEKRVADRTKELAETEELKNMAIQQAQLGIWHIDTTTREFIASERLKELFGFYPHEEVEYDAVAAQVAEDYRGLVIAGVEEAIASGRLYNLEYPVTGYHDKKLRWVRATGKVTPSKDGKKTFFSGTVIDITEQKQDEQRKDDFIGMVSHEMKTPLTSMSGYIQLLQIAAQKRNDSLTVAMTDKANKQIAKLTTLINGFLNVSRLQSGKIYIDKTTFDMAVLLKEAAEETIPMYTNHRLVFEPVEETFVNADRDKIGHVISNLISNAVKYSAANSAIHVACVTAGGMALVSVKDEGIGIQAQDIDKLFGRYYRVENQTTKSIAGFGIGLYLSSEIIQRHGGRIWVESEVGKGSTFHFSLPVLAA